MISLARSRTALGLTAAVFVASRVALLEVTPLASDTTLYARYAFEMQFAARVGIPFYALDAQLERRKAAAQQSPEDATMGYPPLALELLALPALWTDGIPPNLVVGDRLVGQYTRAFRVMTALLDVAVLAVVVWLSRRVRPGEGAPATAARILAYTAAGGLLVHLIYDRLDLWLGAAVLGSLAWLVSGPRWWQAWVLLAVAIELKLVPLLLVPLWLVGSLPAADLRALRARTAARAVVLPAAIRLGVLTLSVLAIHAPFLLRDGRPSLGFLRFHASRGLHVESLYSSLLLPFGGLLPEHIVPRFGGYELASSLSPWFARLAPLLVSAVALSGPWLLLRRLRGAPQSDGSTAVSPTMASSDPEGMIGCCAFVLLGSVVASSVFSPQYLLWSVPLLPLVVPAAWGWRRSVAFYAAVAAMSALTTAIFPYLYYSDVLGFYAPSRAPTALGVAVLLARNALGVGIAVAIARSLIPGRQGPGGLSGAGEALTSLQAAKSTDSAG